MESFHSWRIKNKLEITSIEWSSFIYVVADAPFALDWQTRCKIIEGISIGLRYLHEGSNVPIIHLDLKPANILLDEDFVPKIIDFGLSRLFDPKQTIKIAASTGTL